MTPSRSLGAQPVSLLDTEPVLLVDDDHAELVEFDGVLQQRVRADDDARLAGGDLSARIAFLRGRTSTRSAAPPGCRCRPPEFAGARQRPEHARGSTEHAVRQGLPSAPATHTDSRRRSSAASRAPTRPSCPSPPRPAASGSSVGSRPAPPRSRRGRRAVPRSARRATGPPSPPPARRRGEFDRRSRSQLNSLCLRATRPHCSPAASSKVRRSMARRDRPRCHATWMARSA